MTDHKPFLIQSIRWILVGKYICNFIVMHLRIIVINFNVRMGIFIVSIVEWKSTKNWIFFTACWNLTCKEKDIIIKEIIILQMMVNFNGISCLSIVVESYRTWKDDCFLCLTDENEDSNDYYVHIYLIKYVDEWLIR